MAIAGDRWRILSPISDMPVTICSTCGLDLRQIVLNSKGTPNIPIDWGLATNTINGEGFFSIGESVYCNVLGSLGMPNLANPKGTLGIMGHAHLLLPHAHGCVLQKKSYLTSSFIHRPVI